MSLLSIGVNFQDDFSLTLGFGHRLARLKKQKGVWLGLFLIKKPGPTPKANKPLDLLGPAPTHWFLTTSLAFWLDFPWYPESLELLLELDIPRLDMAVFSASLCDTIGYRWLAFLFPSFFSWFTTLGVGIAPTHYVDSTKSFPSCIGGFALALHSGLRLVTTIQALYFSYFYFILLIPCWGFSKAFKLELCSCSFSISLLGFLIR